MFDIDKAHVIDFVLGILVMDNGYYAGRKTSIHHTHATPMLNKES